MAGSPNSLDKSLSLLIRVIEEGRDCPSLSALADAADLPISTAHRLLGGLERAGLIAQLGRHRYVGGPVLRRLARLQPSPNRILADAARPILSDLSRRTARITHLGILEDGMMTYLLKEGDVDGAAVSRPDMQLEAYCSGVGKALLAHLPQVELDAYLATAPFVALTPGTIIAADALQAELAMTRERGYALDRAEMFDGFICIAVPIRLGNRVIAAISLVVTRTAEPCRPVGYLARLHAAAAQIESRLGTVEDLFTPL
jgi:IclR family acetate operon transcriptional repressor